MTSLALAVPITIVSALGLLLNLYILFVLLVTKQVQTANNLLLLHLGAVDALLCIIFLVFSAPGMLRGWPWLALSTPCNLHGFLFTLLHPVALWTVCGLNCDRYYAITSPLHYGSVVNPKKVIIGLGFTWLVSLVLCIPPLFLVAPYRFNPGLGGCAPDFTQKDGTMWYSLAYTTFTLFLPAILILGCNLRVLMIARYHRHRIASAIFEVTISAQVTITHQRNPFLLHSGNIFRGRSAISTVLQLICSFLILYLPYYSVILWESSASLLVSDWKASSPRFHALLVTLASTLLNCSPPVNGLLYGVKSKLLRKSFQNYWRKQMSKNEVNQEIQARTPSTCGSRRPSITPLGFLSRPTSSHFQRRSSEVFLERRSNSSRSSIQKLASEFSWRPQSTMDIRLDPAEPLWKSKSFREASFSKHSSCNVLQVPNERDLIRGDVFPSYKFCKVAITRKLSDTSDRASQMTFHEQQCSGSNTVFQNIVGSSNSKLVEMTNMEQMKTSAMQVVMAPAKRRSPRILITRAFSEEHDQSSSKSSPPICSERMSRAYSSSTTTLDAKNWKRLRYKNEEEPSGKEKESFRANRSSSSTSENDNESENLNLSFGTRPCSPEVVSGNSPTKNQHGETTGGEHKFSNSDNEPLYVFSWPTRRKSIHSCGSSTVSLARSITNIAGVSEL